MQDRIFRRIEVESDQLVIQQDDLSSLSLTEDKAARIYCGTPVITTDNKLEAILFTAEKLSESAYNHDDLELLNLFAEN